MKKFLFKCLIFIIPILISIILFEFLLREIPNDYSLKKKYMDLNSNQLEVLFLGNSHFLFGINPIYMSYNSYNFANSSQSLDIDLKIIENYKGNLNNLKFLVLPIDYSSLYYKLEEGDEKWRLKNYSIYYDFNDKNIFNNFELLNGRVKNNFYRVYNFLSYKIDDISCNKLGFSLSYSKNYQNLLKSGNIAAKRHTVNMKEKNDTFKKNIHNLKRMIRFSKKNKIKLIFITTPCYKTYTSKLNKIQLNKTIFSIKRFINNKTVFYYNLLDQNSFGVNDYYDADHLNEKGAKKLTLLVDSLLHLI